MLRDLEVLAFDDSSWTTEAFYRAKVAEQEERNAKHDDSDNRLEPDIKNAPGGLRIYRRRSGWSENISEPLD